MMGVPRWEREEEGICEQAMQVRDLAATRGDNPNWGAPVDCCDKYCIFRAFLARLEEEN